MCGYTIVTEKCQLLQAEEEATTHPCQAAVGCPRTCYQSIDKESVLCQLPNAQDNITDKQWRTGFAINPKLLQSPAVQLPLSWSTD